MALQWRTQPRCRQEKPLRETAPACREAASIVTAVKDTASLQAGEAEIAPACREAAYNGTAVEDTASQQELTLQSRLEALYRVSAGMRSL